MLERRIAAASRGPRGRTRRPRPRAGCTLDDDELLHRIETLRRRARTRTTGCSRWSRATVTSSSARRPPSASRTARACSPSRTTGTSGQILVRHLTRREDVTYLERLSARSHHVEVRSAAQVQLARLWRRLDAPGGAEPGSRRAQPPLRRAGLRRRRSRSARRAAQPEPVTSAPLENEAASTAACSAGPRTSWSSRPGRTSAPRPRASCSPRTRRDLLGRHPSLVYFEISADAHVATNLDGGPRLPRRHRHGRRGVDGDVSGGRCADDDARGGAGLGARRYRDDGRRAARRGLLRGLRRDGERACAARRPAASASGRRASSAGPLEARLVREAHPLEHPRDRVRHDVVDARGASGRTPAPAGTRSRPSRRRPASGAGGPTWSGVSRTSASERPALLERHVAGARDQRVGVAARERRERLDRARRDDHRRRCGTSRSRSRRRRRGRRRRRAPAPRPRAACGRSPRASVRLPEALITRCTSSEASFRSCSSSRTP